MNKDPFAFKPLGLPIKSMEEDAKKIKLQEQITQTAGKIDYGQQTINWINIYAKYDHKRAGALMGQIKFDEQDIEF